MLLEKQRARETANYKGLAIRTIIQTVWLIITGTIAYFVLQRLFEEEIISYTWIYSRFFIPNWVPEWVLLAAIILIIVIIMQFFLLLGFAFFSPLGRIRPGKPSLRKTVVDPLEESEYRSR